MVPGKPTLGGKRLVVLFDNVLVSGKIVRWFVNVSKKVVALVHLESLGDLRKLPCLYTLCSAIYANNSCSEVLIT